jgi:uncharacterized protein YerC
MARVSKSKLDKITYTQVLDTLDFVLGKLKKDEIRTFLYSLMSGPERLMIAKRFAAITLIQQGMPTSEISRKLKITRSTINKLKIIIRAKDKGFSLSLKKLNQEKMAKEIKNILIGIANEMGSSSRIKRINKYPHD